jgi:hypothetical protein
MSNPGAILGKLKELEVSYATKREILGAEMINVLRDIGN